MAYASIDRQREISRQHRQKETRESQEIPEIAPRKNPERWEKCRYSFKAFCETYQPIAFQRRWSKDHLEILDIIENVMIRGDRGNLITFVMPRGSGKTTISISAAAWGILYGHVNYVGLIGATKSKGCELLDALKTMFRFNKTISEDFSYEVAPVIALEGESRRCNGQRYQGVPTGILWEKYRVKFPTIDGALSSGAIIHATSLKGDDIRGLFSKKMDGDAVDRPDFLVIDDPQSRDSARSADQCSNRIKLLNGDILGLAGPGKTIRATMTNTVIEPNDLASQILDSIKSPEWIGKKYKMLYKMPENMKLWDEYYQIRCGCLRRGESTNIATRFYEKNREEMSRGAVVAWKERFDPEFDEIDGLQSAMNLYFRSPVSFFAEYQNSPEEIGVQLLEKLKPQELERRINTCEEGIVRNGMQHVIASIDVHKKLLYCTVCAFTNDYTAQKIMHFVYPKQNSAIFTLNSCPNPLPGKNTIVELKNALADVVRLLTSQKWERADSSLPPLRTNLILIDTAWEDRIIYDFVSNSPYAAMILPYKGRYFSPDNKQIHEYQRRANWKFGDYWFIADPAQTKEPRHAVVDVNRIRTQIVDQLRIDPHFSGAFTLNRGNIAIGNQGYINHMVAETPYNKEGRTAGRNIIEWKNDDKADNHWWDATVGCFVGASVRGCQRAEAKKAPIVATKDSPVQDNKTPHPHRSKSKRKVHYF